MTRVLQTLLWSSEDRLTAYSLWVTLVVSLTYGMNSKERKRQRDREYYHKNRERLIEQTLSRRQNYIQEAKDHLGGICVWCGSTEQLEFDHIDDALKLDNICRVYRKHKTQDFWDEVNKCQLLCKSCHNNKNTAMRRAKQTLWLSLPFEQRQQMINEALT